MRPAAARQRSAKLKRCAAFSVSCYLTYLPRGLQPGAPPVLMMHRSGESAAQIRVGTGYGFERLADQHLFAVVYPNAHSFDWNDCSRVGDFSVNGAEVDGVGFLGALVDKLVNEIGADPRRVFATGVSAGGFMSMRLALEAPARFRAVSAAGAACRWQGQSPGPVLQGWPWHAATVRTPAALAGPVADGAERTGNDLGLLRPPVTRVPSQRPHQRGGSFFSSTMRARDTVM